MGLISGTWWDMVKQIAYPAIEVVALAPEGDKVLSGLLNFTASSIILCFSSYSFTTILSWWINNAETHYFRDVIFYFH